MTLKLKYDEMDSWVYAHKLAKLKKQKNLIEVAANLQPPRIRTTLNHNQHFNCCKVNTFLQILS